MSVDIHRYADVPVLERARLSDALAEFYRNPPPSYYCIADGAARHYNEREQPFHCDLVSQVRPGTRVLEMGCGTAHLCAQVEQRGGFYTGVDHSDALLAENRRRFPSARFLRLGDPLSEQFDLVASLYTIEHVVDPPTYLKDMWDACKPGGLLVVICPEFVDSPGFPPSVFFGRTPGRLRKKIQDLALADAVAHVLDLKRGAAAWKRVAKAAAPGAFWLNLRPRVLFGADYAIDTDAVHLVRRQDIVWFFQQSGAKIVRTSTEMPGVSPDILRFNAYVLARKQAPSR